MRPLDLIVLSVAMIAGNMLAVDRLCAQAPPVAPAVTAPAIVEPPPPRQETITVAPSPQTVWVPGAWERTPDTWLWTSGRWVTPPFRRAYWASGYWQHVGGRYQWLPGHWAAGAQGAVVAQKVALPAPLTEVQPAPPAGVNNLVWTPGRWEWRGTWTWVPGHYVESSNPQAMWVPGEWDPATDGAWRWNPAHWAVK